MSEKYEWAAQEERDGCEVIVCDSYDPNTFFIRDPSGYYCLIRPNFETYRIEIAVCDKDHVVERKFSGCGAQEVYHGVLKYEKRNNLNWFQEKTHIAYLGKELKKAELALVMGNNSYFQE